MVANENKFYHTLSCIYRASYGQIVGSPYLNYRNRRSIMAELEEFEQEDVRPLLEEILEDLDSIRDRWREVGKVLNVSKETLDELQSHSKGADRDVNDKNNFEVVMKEWIDKNTSAYMWPPLLQVLKNNNFPLDYENLREAHCPAANTDGEC